MRSITRGLIDFLRQEQGVTAIECALMLALVIVICIVAINPASPKRAAGNSAIVEIKNCN